MSGPLQEDDEDGDDGGDLQGRKVIKSFFLFLFLLFLLRRSFVRGLVKVSHFYKDEREEMKRQRRPPPSHSNLPLPTPPKMQIRSEKGSRRPFSGQNASPKCKRGRSVMEGASRPDSKSEPDSFSEPLSVCTGNLQKNLPRLCEIGCSSCVLFTYCRHKKRNFSTPYSHNLGPTF